jgi:hypothetical protein
MGKKRCRDCCHGAASSSALPIHNASLHDLRMTQIVSDDEIEILSGFRTGNSAPVVFFT